MNKNLTINQIRVIVNNDIKRYKRALIKKCSNPEFWYANRIGRYVFVRPVQTQEGEMWLSSYCEAKNGATVLKHDLEYKGEL